MEVQIRRHIFMPGQRWAWNHCISVAREIFGLGNVASSQASTIREKEGCSINSLLDFSAVAVPILVRIFSAKRTSKANGSKGSNHTWENQPLPTRSKTA